MERGAGMKNILANGKMLFLPVMVILIGCSTEPLTMKIKDSNAFRNAKSIEILDFSTEGATIKYEGDTDSLGHALALLVQQYLQLKAEYLDISIGEKESITSDLVVEGGFTKIDEGDANDRVMIGLGNGSVVIELDGVIKKSDGMVVASFNTIKESAGGPIGMGGPLASDANGIIESLMEEIAKELTDFIIFQTTRN
jgi:hypothetical protein